MPTASLPALTALALVTTSDAAPLEIDAPALVPGEPLQLTSTGAAPGTLVRFAAGPFAGSGPCLPTGDCLAIASPKVIATGVADPSGTATGTWLAPVDMALGAEVIFQAIAVAPPVAQLSDPLFRVFARTTPFVDDFDSGVLSADWYFTDEGVTVGVPTFRPELGEVHESGGSYDGDTGSWTDKGALLWNSATSMIDGVLRADMRLASDGAMGMVYGIGLGARSYYRVTIDHGYGYARLSRIDEGVPVLLTETWDYAPPFDVPIRIRIERHGTLHEVYLDDALVLTTHDSAHPGGSVGLYARGTTEAWWNFTRIDIRPATCGDGVVDADEACDDGNLDELDGCDTVCAAE